ncbi:MAG: hypothetical protein Q4C47_08605 [Planctomycetia bacterium]|nr:hypothetical protein [Planctomycetia bacterium]
MTERFSGTFSPESGAFHRDRSVGTRRRNVFRERFRRNRKRSTGFCDRGAHGRIAGGATVSGVVTRDRRRPVSVAGRDDVGTDNDWE